MIRPSNEDPRSAQDASAQLAASATQPGISREDSIDGARRIHLVAHGLREPLRTVTGYLDLVAEGSEKLLDEETRAHVDRALDGARRLRSRIEAYVAWERAGLLDPAGMVDLEDVLRSVLDDVGLGEDDTLARDGELPTVHGDRVALATVLEELLRNAVRFRAAHPLVVRITATRDGADHVIVIEDNGRGFESRHAERAFEPFTRLHADAAGPGMGLAIARRIVERHGGTLTGIAEAGRGATFTLRLPAEVERTG